MKAPPEEPARKSLIPAVGEDHLQSGHFSEQSPQHRWSRLGIVLIGRVHYNCKKQAQHIDDHVALPTGYLLVRIATSARAALAFGVDRLGVNDRSTGTGLASGRHASGPTNPVLAIEMA